MNATTRRTLRFALASLCTIAVLAIGCGSSSDSNPGGGGSGGHAGTGGTPEQTGSSCTTATQCYPSVDLDASALKGTATCLTQVTGGYCTHTCKTDADCCAAPGECKTNIPEVCSSFESTGQMYCFLSCEDSVVATANVSYDGGVISDPTLYCQVEANAAFTCRSTGGGVNNRKVCLP